ncbi:MAG: L,D-transpeptidase scaffold domain-containing protein [Mucilaginibacter sp.]
MKNRAALFLNNRTIKVVLFMLLLCGSLRSFASGNVPAGKNFGGKDTSVSALIQQYLTSGKTNSILYYPKSLKRFYESGNYQAAWVERQTNTKQTWEAMLALDCVLQYGLSHDDYHPKELLYDPLHTMIEEPAKISNDKKARFDILLTDALINFMNNLHYGKLNPVYSAEKIDQGLMLPFHAEAALIAARQQTDFMSAVAKAQPQGKQYLALQDRMRVLKGQKLEDCYEVPDTEVRKIAINMERLRWAEIDDKSYIEINIPTYMLKFSTPDTTYEFKVVVGKTTAQTPTLNSNITYFTTFPEWKIPQKIFINEIVPKALADISYLENSHFSIYDKGGNYVRASKASLVQVKRNPNLYYARQSNGCDNALGQLVFRFQNQYDIYLHDTPEQQFFKKDVRTFSHSCIRVERAQELARLLLKYDDNSSKIVVLDRAMKSRLTKNITFKKPVPIKIVYLTCEVKEGVVINYKDVYNLDKRLEMALYGTPPALTEK